MFIGFDRVFDIEGSILRCIQIWRREQFKISKGIKTGRAQWSKMLELAKLKPDIGQGLPLRSTDEINEFWEHLAMECNLLGPPFRDALEWRKVWSLWKNYVKRKLIRCKNDPTRRPLTRLEEQVISMIKFPGVDVSAITDPKATNKKTTTRKLPSAKANVGIDIEILPESENNADNEKFVYDSDRNEASTEVGSQLRNNPNANSDTDYESANTPQKFHQVCFPSHPPSTPLHYNEVDEEEKEDSELKLLQQQRDLQKKTYKETKKFQMSTSTVLQDISLTINNLRGSMQRVEDVSLRCLKEEIRLNRKTEDLLQKLVQRNFF
ncbi:uncharacterized protein [Eurosta solidaginis]|uniref:uncharacterized protein isoform X2 n=1 Tax=Eurosta solidaginis TaxID=178769 RepID=UPI003530AC8B